MSRQAFSIVQLTAVGRGAVATVLADGPGAIAAVNKHFSPRGRIHLTDCPPDRLLVGRFGPAGEEVVVHRQGQNTVALHCHGGLAAVSMVIELLCAEGGTPVSWQQWIRGQHDAGHDFRRWRAEAQIALAHARTERTAAILLDQLNGALEREVAEAEALISHGQGALAAERLSELLGRYQVGRHLIQPWRVVLAGPVNAGKSSLLNALAGFNRAIVHPMPGATRDALTVATALDGWPMELCDTAGLRPTDDELERAGIDRAWQTVAEADLVVWIFDLSICWQEQHAAIVGSMRAIDEPLRSSVGPLVPCADGTLPGTKTAAVGAPRSKPVLLVYNKSDLLGRFQPRGLGIITSAVSGAGVSTLAEAIVATLVGDPPPPGAAVPFTAEQQAHLERLLGSLGCLR